MSTVGWYIAVMHQLLGHDTAARFLGVNPGDKARCLICVYEKNPTDENRAVVVEVLS